MNKTPTPFPIATLATLPTPVRPLPAIGGHLFMKQDNLSGPVYGGNKIRKLEFLLGEAMAEERKSVITYGAAGSNHALATAVCCRQLGLHAISILAPQETSDHVRKNILMQHAVGAELHLCPDYNHFPALTQQLCTRCRQEDGIEPYIIPAGGSNTTGALGFVNAALELAGQITNVPPGSLSQAPEWLRASGLPSRQDGGDTAVPRTAGLPCPDVIYIPMGTGGTLAGLLVGLKLAGLNTRVEAIRVVEPAFRNESHIQRLCDDLCTLLTKSFLPQRHRDTEDGSMVNTDSLCLCGEDIPLIQKSDIVIRDEFFGEGYGVSTPEAEEAVELFQAKENVQLETTYTGKTAAALLHDLHAGRLDGQTVLYWNTLNSRDFSAEIANIDFHDLPPAFHGYLE